MVSLMGFTASRFIPYIEGMANAPSKTGDDGDTRVLTRVAPQVKKPSRYKVLLLNDDYTPMEFVIMVLEQFFGKSREDAYAIMMHVHQKGVGGRGNQSHAGDGLCKAEQSPAAMHAGKRIIVSPSQCAKIVLY
jgi:ATP-dependent Clp protease adapter protein ClpS